MNSSLRGSLVAPLHSANDFSNDTFSELLMGPLLMVGERFIEMAYGVEQVHSTSVTGGSKASERYQSVRPRQSESNQLGFAES
jgi:hypothetical protein